MGPVVQKNMLRIFPKLGYGTVEFHELGQKVRILGQGQEQDSSVD